MEFIIFGSHAQLKKLASHLSVMTDGNSMHPTGVIINLGVWFDAIYSFSDHVRNVCKINFIHMCDLNWV